MFAARSLARRAFPVLRQTRWYADPPSATSQMSFTFASPTEVFYKEANVKQIDVPTLTGAFGILPAHVPTLQVLRPGVVTVFSEDGSSAKYFVSSGSVTVNADSSVQLLAEEAVTLDNLDLATAKANLEKAQADLGTATDEASRAEAQISIEANEAIVKALE
ncbi:ATP synthase subunit delta, mitochondrial [Brienomyrus brachyistius]|uniref:ATP synthase subunit delta, mitochondrial n=1 Tax=Brienomyrus brachyistius TaxID=42636 RepID=UPI0020B1E4F7|nr:ATP synthase subunit delta, mitochondrial [Brienomyrus brachyistius]